MDTTAARDLLSDLSPEQRRQLLRDLARSQANGTKERPPSPGQKRFWFFEQLEPGTGVSNIPFVLRLRGALHVPTLYRALLEIARRHDVLRTTIGLRDGQPVQRIAAIPAVSLPVIDLRQLPRESREAEADRQCRELGGRCLDLASGPLWTSTLLRLTEDQFRLVIVTHHAISDAWSIQLMVSELVAAYDAFSKGTTPVLPTLPIQYGDYAAREADAVAAGRYRGELQYWRSRLGGTLPVLEMPSDYPRPERQTFGAAFVTSSIEADTSRRLRTLARSAGATPFMVLLAVFKTLICRLSGVADVIVGTPIVGRASSDVEPLIGLFINTVALRTDLQGDPSFVDLLQRVRTTALDAYEHQALPFDSMVAELHPDRVRSRTPVFQVLFNMFDRPHAALRFRMGSVDVEFAEQVDVASKFDFTLYVRTAGDAFALRLLYNTDLFSHDRMTEVLAQFAAVAEQVAADPSIRVSQIDLSTERSRSVAPDPRAPLAVGSFPSIVSRLHMHARETPERTAVVDSRVAWTFGELDRRSDRLAKDLHDAGIGPGETVAIFAHRSAPLVLAMTAVLKAGAAFCVLDSAYPAARLVKCIELARPAAWLRLAAAGEVPSDVARAIAAVCRTEICVSDEAGTNGDAPAFDLVQPDPDRPAYVAFTSGSTGGVKAIVGTERPVAHFLEWHVRTFDLAATDRFSMLSGLAHDPLLRDVFTPLWIGAALVIPDPGRLRDGMWLATWLRNERITAVHLTPSHARIIADGAAVTGTLPELRYLFFGGDVLRDRIVEAARQMTPAARCIGFYGATETPQAMGCWMVPVEGRVKPSLGVGIDGVQLLVTTDRQTLAGIGEPGEIWIRTPYLARRYLHDAELTRARFIDNPFTADAGDRVFRTGDIGRYRPDGAVEFLGRRDWQVKVRGFRVELTEVEQALLQHPALAEVAVLVRADADGELQPVAYCVAAPGVEALSDGDLRQFLAARLPGYAIPGAFVFVPEMPITLNGKIDRDALAKSDAVACAVRTCVPPRTPTERELVRIWSEVLAVDDLGVEHDFFACGGHSLLATQIMSRVHARFGVDVPLRALFESPTIAALGRLIDDARAGQTPGGALLSAAGAGDVREELEI